MISPALQEAGMKEKRCVRLLLRYFGVLVLSFSHLFLRHDTVVCLKWSIDPRRVTHDNVIGVFINVL